MIKFDTGTSISEICKEPVPGNISPPSGLDPDKIQYIKNQSFVIPSNESTQLVLKKRSFTVFNASSEANTGSFDSENIQPPTKIPKIDAAIKPKYIPKFPNKSLFIKNTLITTNIRPLDVKQYLPTDCIYESLSKDLLEAMQIIYMKACYSLFRTVSPTDCKANTTLELSGELSNVGELKPLVLPFQSKYSNREWQIWGTGENGFVVKTCYKESREKLIDKINDLVFGSDSKKYLGIPHLDIDRLYWIHLFADTGFLFERSVPPPTKEEEQDWIHFLTEMKNYKSGLIS